MKKLLTMLCVGVLALGMTGCASSSSSSDGGSLIDKIKEGGVLKVGCKNDVIGFGLQDTGSGEYKGYEIELIKYIADDLGVEPEYTAVTAKTRTALLDSGEIDMVCGTFTITGERKESWDFTDPYFTDYEGMLIQKGKYAEVKDMDGATVAVPQSAIGRAATEEYTKEIGISVEFKEYASAAEAVTALNSGVVDGFCTDVTGLTSYLNDGTTILPDRYYENEFGIATRKDDDKEWNKYLNDTIKELKENGQLDKWQKEFKIGEYLEV